MGYNGNNRKGLPQRGSGYNKQDIKLGGSVCKSLIGIFGIFFGKFGILILLLLLISPGFITIFLIFITVYVLLFIVALVYSLRCVANPPKMCMDENAEKDNIKYINYSAYEQRRYSIELNDAEKKLCNTLSSIEYPYCNNRLAKKHPRMGSYVMRKKDEQIMFVIGVEKGRYKCFDFASKDCNIYTINDFVND